MATIAKINTNRRPDVRRVSTRPASGNIDIGFEVVNAMSLIVSTKSQVCWVEPLDMATWIQLDERIGQFWTISNCGLPPGLETEIDTGEDLAPNVSRRHNVA